MTYNKPLISISEYRIMFDSLSDRLGSSLRKLSGSGRLTEVNIQDSLREVRKALLEADVALPVVKAFINDIRSKALGLEITKKLNPGDALVKLVRDELVTIMGDTIVELDLKTAPPAVILMAGLQGSGKTTTVAKLANWLKKKQGKSVLVTSADVYRPAAIQQLETLAEQVGANFFPSDPSQKPVQIAKDAIKQAKNDLLDVVIIDTAGRLHIDDEMMGEIRELHKSVNPSETLFVVDSMTGQDAANTAKAFHDAIPLTGIVLTKTDGDARGGAALSIRYITGKPIKFMGVGEKIDALEAFHPDRVASRILGMGDILSLVEDVQSTVDRAQSEKLAKKIKKGKGFDLQDFLGQLEQMRNMGGVGSILGKLPGMGQLPQAAKEGVNDGMFDQMKAMIESMTFKERYEPDIINGSRKRRIAKGSGTTVPDLNRLLKQFKQMQKMMKKLKGGGMMKMMKKMQHMMPKGGGGGLPF